MMHIGGGGGGGYYEYSGEKNLYYCHSNGPLEHRMERHTCMGPAT